MSTSQVATRLLLLALALGMVGGSCNEPSPLTISQPGKATRTWMPLFIQLDMFQSVNLETLEVTLNGVDITDLMTITVPPKGAVTAKLADYWDPAVLVQGANRIEATALFGTQNQVFRFREFTTVGDAYADAVDDFTPGTGGGFGSEAAVLGAPFGGGLFTGGLDVLSLGLDGEIVVEFTDNIIVDRGGVDFTVFENAFLELSLALLTEPPFSEPALVEVSQDGVSWFAFDACILDPSESPLYPGCAGVYPVLADAGDPATPHASIPTDTPIEDLLGVDALTLADPPGAGGDSFDLADVGLAWARFVRIRAADFVDGPVGANNAGFDLDAVAAVNSVPATDANGNGVPDAVE